MGMKRRNVTQMEMMKRRMVNDTQFLYFFVCVCRDGWLKIRFYGTLLNKTFFCFVIYCNFHCKHNLKIYNKHVF